MGSLWEYDIVGLTVGIRYCGVRYGNPIFRFNYGNPIVWMLTLESYSVELLMGILYCGVRYGNPILWGSLWESYIVGLTVAHFGNPILWDSL